MIKRVLKLSPLRISIMLAVVVSALYLSGFSFLLDMMELKAYDLRFKSRGDMKPGDEVAIAVIDEKSLDVLGRWPWPRSVIAQLVDRLSEGGARVIGFDIVFSEPEENSFLRNANLIKRKLEERGATDAKLREYFKTLEQEADNDARLAGAIKDSGRVVEGYFFHFQKEGLEHMDKESLRKYLATIEFSNYEEIFYASKKAADVHFLEGYAVESNIGVISEAATDFGYFNFVPDSDGVVRQVPLLIEYRGDELFPGANLFPPLSLKLAAEYLGRPQLSLEVNELGVERVQLGERVIPTDEKGRMLINYMGGEKTFPHYSIIDILKGNVPADAFKDKVVLVGATAVGIYDVRVTPFQTNFPGVEIHANVIDNILHNRYLVKPEWAQHVDLAMILALVGIGIKTRWMLPVGVDLAMILALGIGLGLILRKVKAAGGVVALVAMLAGFLYFNRYMFIERGIWLNLVYPGVSLVLNFAGITVYRYMTEEKEKRFIKGAFGQYLAPSVVNQLLRDPSMLKLGGERRVLTAFFSDIQGFTSISETMTPEDLVALLNEYLTDMSNIIHKYEGTIDKYEGDAIVAFFGAPVPQEDHARRACLASVEMQEKLVAMREAWPGEGKPVIHVRIGLNTGPMVVGNMGSKERMDYTIMGDSVNLAARLEPANKGYGTYMMMGEETYKQASDNVEARELDLLRVVGKKEPVRVYELLGRKGEVEPLKMDAMKLYRQGIEDYSKMEWDAAIDLFKRALSLNGDDGPCRVYIQRCEEYKAAPPPEGWDGVYVLTHK